MPVSYQYLQVSDGESISLNTIDELMCEATGVTVDPEKYCMLFQCMQWTGMAVASLSDGFTSSKEGFEKYKAKNPEMYKDWEVVERFLVTEYNYHCWR